MLSHSFKPKACDICGKSFIPMKAMQRVCGLVCAKKVPKVLKAKSAKALRERKEKAKTLSQHKADAQRVRNRYVLLRDANEGCISCGTRTADAYQAGHWRSRGSAPHLALDLRNIHKQCVRCNLHLHGNPIGYRVGLVATYGDEWVQALESDQAPRHYTVDDYKAMQAEDRRAIKQLKESRE